jgi:magnesium-transporting ATPase (P-type)
MTTLITNGQGHGIVVKTGANTAIGNIANMVNKANEKTTSLQKELNAFIFKIVCFAIITALILLIWWASKITISHPNYITLP